MNGMINLRLLQPGTTIGLSGRAMRRWGQTHRAVSGSLRATCPQPTTLRWSGLKIMIFAQDVVEILEGT